MCIVLLTTAHPEYALIIIDNRDEFILRPTSRPHWWTHASGASVLSSRDLQRAEKGTWLGITKDGVFAILTNFRETSPDDASHPIHTSRSRGGMVTAWLGSGVKQSAADSVHHLVNEIGVKGVGGFSMVSGKLRRRKDASSEKWENSIEPVAVISNRCDHVNDVPWIGEKRGEVYGLSNTSFANPKSWPKVENGKHLLKEAIEDAVAKGLSEEELASQLFSILDTDTLPKHPDMSLSDYVAELKHSIFVPALGDEAHRKAMQEASSKGHVEWAAETQKAEDDLKIEERPDANGVGFETGMYGTQRQTVILVDWDGNVSYRERALWDKNGNAIEKAQGDVVFKFKIEGWGD